MLAELRVRQRRGEIDGLGRGQQLDGDFHSTLLMICRACRPAIGPLETWSSQLAEVRMVSALAGWTSALFSEANGNDLLLGEHEAGVEAAALGQEVGEHVAVAAAVGQPGQAALHQCCPAP